MPPWSYSSLSKFETCPLQYYHTKVAKDVLEKPTEHTRWGQYVHKAMELRAADGVPLPDDLNYLEPALCKITTTPREHLYAERQYALDADFNSVKWGAPDAWVRAIVDLELRGKRTAVIFDWKTGKNEPGPDQLNLAAAIIMQGAPEISTVATGYLMIRTGRAKKALVDRVRLPDIWGDFIARVSRLEAAYDKDRWVASPSGLCNGWCPVGRDKCDFWRPKKGRRS